MYVLSMEECALVAGGQTPPPPSGTPPPPPSDSPPPGSPSEQDIDKLQKQMDEVLRQQMIDDCINGYANFGTAAGGLIGVGATIAAAPATGGVSLGGAAWAGAGGAGLGNLIGDGVGQAVCPGIVDGYAN